jgi:molybdopterin-binding protein
MLRVEHLRCQVGNFALKDVSFNVADGEYFVLLGASGMGKSVLLETLSGLRLPDSGTIKLNGQNITTEPPNRRHLALVFQNQALFPHMSVAKNIGYGLPRKERTAERIQELAKKTGAEHLLNRAPATLSGGEAQRVAMARALATDPKCLLLDEPLASLDRHARAEMRQLLRELNRQGLAIIHVTHDYEEALSLAARVGIMEKGQVVQTGEPEDVFHRPKTEFVARFTGIRNFFRGELFAPQNNSNAEMSLFKSENLEFHVLTDSGPGLGFIIFRSEDVLLSSELTDSSARNCFCGTISDIIPSPLGVEVEMDIGQHISALITRESVEKLKLKRGKKIYASIKASAARFIED